MNNDETKINTVRIIVIITLLLWAWLLPIIYDFITHLIKNIL